MGGARRVRIAAAVVLGAGLLVLSPTAPVGADGNEAPGAPVAFRSLSSGGSHSCAIRYDGAVRCWGRNDAGQLGLGDTADRGDAPGEMGDNLPTVDLGTGRTATAISASSNGHTCALLDDGTVKCWGRNTFGRLGLGDTNNRGDGPNEMGDNLPIVDLGTGRTATAITANGSGACALLDTAQVKCWGRNGFGELGLGAPLDRGDDPGEMGNNLPTVDLGSGRSASAITASGEAVCALLDTAQVKCWGSNGNGRLGLGDTNNRGDQTGEMGDNLPTVALGIGRSATAVSAAVFHTCALLDNGSVKCWGANPNGQLGLGDVASRGDAPGEMGDALPAVDLGQTATAVTAGSNMSCALLSTHQVRCWGANASGELGLGDIASRGDGPGEMGVNLPIVDLGPSHTATAISTGTAFACSLLDDDTVKCWGSNGFGQLGLGDLDDRGDGAGELGANLPWVELPPPNDTFSTPDAIAGSSGSRVGSNGSATWQSPSEPEHDGLQFAFTSVWYRWTAPASGRVRFDTLTSTFDTVLAVYTGNAVNSLAPVASNNDVNPGIVTQSRVVFTAQAGVTYQVAVAGNDAVTGRIALHWSQAPPCGGQPVTVALAFGDVPTTGSDVILGTPAADTIDGLDGDDRVCGDAGVDVLSGGPGVDRLFGQDGNDTLNGGTGTDVVDGGNQNDTLNGNDGVDTMVGGSGNDTLNGGNQNDTANGGAGNDRAFGNNGNDTLNGQQGADTLDGGAGADRLNGGTQRDTCRGGPQNDSQSGCEVRTSIP